MTEIVLTKTPSGTLAPVDQTGMEYIAKLKVGAGVKATIKRARNVQFHRKLFALLNIAFDAWEPVDKEYKGVKIAKNFNQFRNDVTVLAGYYETTVTLKGEVRLTAKSISFANMDEDEFGALYSSIIDVILARILTKYTREDLDRVVDEVLRFA
jgi:hypothetical protein